MSHTQLFYQSTIDAMMNSCQLDNPALRFSMNAVQPSWRDRWMLLTVFWTLTIVGIIGAFAIVKNMNSFYRITTSYRYTSVRAQAIGSARVMMQGVDRYPADISTTQRLELIAHSLLEYSIESTKMHSYVIDSNGRVLLRDEAGELPQIATFPLGSGTPLQAPVNAHQISKEWFLSEGYPDAAFLYNLEEASDTLYSSAYSRALNAIFVMAIPKAGVRHRFDSFLDQFPRTTMLLVVGLTGFVIPVSLIACTLSVRRMKRAFHDVTVLSQQYQCVFLENPTPAILVEADSGKLVDANHSAVSFYGYPRESLNLQLLTDHTAAGGTEKTHPIKQWIEELRRGKSVQAWNRLANNDLRRVTFDATNVDIDGGHFLLIMISDITRQHELEQAIESISDQERERIGQDLHDSVGSHLAGIAYLTEILELSLRPEVEIAAEKAGRIAELIHEAAQQVRESAQGLMSIDNDPGGLPRAIQAYIARIQQLHNECAIRFLNTAGETLLTGQSATQLFRILQEAINNAIRHGSPKTIEITLDFDLVDHSLRLIVSDDGVGFQPGGNGASCSGLGMSIMRTRSESIGGSLSIHSQPRQGTTIVCTIPVTESSRTPQLL